MPHLFSIPNLPNLGHLLTYFSFDIQFYYIVAAGSMLDLSYNGNGSLQKNLVSVRLFSGLASSQP